jgi:hypothetical protein
MRLQLVSRGDEVKLDPKTLSLISAACTQMQARSIRLRFSSSLVTSEDSLMAETDQPHS